MDKKCVKCLSKNKELIYNVDCYQCNIITEYNKKSKKEFGKFLNFLLFGFWVVAGSTIINNILFKFYPNTDFGLSFGFLGVCLCFCIYCLPIKIKKRKRD